MKNDGDTDSYRHTLNAKLSTTAQPPENDVGIHSQMPLVGMGRRFPVRVEYANTAGLDADDICDQFEKYGPVCDFEFLDDTDTNATVEDARVFSMTQRAELRR